MKDTTHILAFGPHPDDLELGVGGILAQAVSQGCTVAMVDLSYGEMATWGTPEIRLEESRKAAEELGVELRLNMGFDDGCLGSPFLRDEQTEQLAGIIRRFKPQVVLIPGGDDRHPDHRRTEVLLEEACFNAGLAKYNSSSVLSCSIVHGNPEKEVVEQLMPWRPMRIYYYHINSPWSAGAVKAGAWALNSLLIDVSNHYEIKKRAILAHQSQFDKCLSDSKLTLGIPSLNHMIEDRDRYLGRLIGAEFAEPLHCKSPIGLTNLIGFDGLRKGRG